MAIIFFNLNFCFHRASEDMGLNTDKLAVVTSNGDVTWVPYLIFKSHCPMDFHAYPFDKQQCNLWFGSWTYDITKVNILLGNHSTHTDMFLSDVAEWEVGMVTMVTIGIHHMH